MMMKHNVGEIDMTARIIAGIVLLIVGLSLPMNSIVQIALLIVGAIALITGVLRYCPINGLLGINTSKHKFRESKG